jgi:hypothetical protein
MQPRDGNDGAVESQEKQTTLSLPFHAPLEISPNTVRFPHSHPTADEKIETLLTDSKKSQLDEKCQPCARSDVSTMSPAAQFGTGPPGLGDGSLLRFSHAGTHGALALPPALKRMIRIEPLSRSAKALLPAHTCERGLPQLIWTSLNFSRPFGTGPRVIGCRAVRICEW